MKKQAGLPPPLGVPGKLAIVGNEVGMSLNEHWRRNQLLHHLAVPLHNELVGSIDRRQSCMSRQRDHERIVEATLPLKHGTAAGTSAKYRSSSLNTSGAVHFGLQVVSITQHDKIILGFPKTEDRFDSAGIAQIQQDLVANQILQRITELGSQNLHKSVGYSPQR